MSKLLHENLVHARILDEETGELRPLLDFAGEQLSKVVSQVAARGKAGSFTLKIDLKPSTAGALAVKGTISTKMPVAAPAESLMWATPEGNLLADDPRQEKLPLKMAESKPLPLKSAA